MNSFSKNKFHVQGYSSSLYNKNIDTCKKYSLQNKKAGFEYKGNYNHCYLYKSKDPSKKLPKNLINNYQISKFNKTKSQIEATPATQSSNDFYFTEVNHYNMDNSGLMKKHKVQNIDQCQEKCLDAENCESIQYFQQPKSCTFYDKIEYGKFTPKKNVDIYTVNQKADNSEEYNIEEEESENSDQEENELQYTDCFTDTSYTNYKKMKESYDKICERKFGEEYKFVNEGHIKNRVSCDNDQIKIHCKPYYLEKFQNTQNTEQKKMSLLYVLLCILFFIGIVYIIYFFFT